MSLGYFEIDSQRPMSMRSSDTLMISPFAAMPGMLSVTRKEAFFMFKPPSERIKVGGRRLLFLSSTIPEDYVADELVENIDWRKSR